MPVDQPWELWGDFVDTATLNAKGGPSSHLFIPSDVLLTYSMMAGKSEMGARVLSATPAGALRTADVGAGYSHMDVKEGTVLNTTAVITFAELVTSVIINIDAFQCTIAHSLDGNIYDNPFNVLAGEKVAIDIVTKSLRIINTSGTTATGYRIWGLYYPLANVQNLASGT